MSNLPRGSDGELCVFGYAGIQHRYPRKHSFNSVGLILVYGISIQGKFLHELIHDDISRDKVGISLLNQTRLHLQL